jgi:hypothetical protein
MVKPRETCARRPIRIQWITLRWIIRKFICKKLTRAGSFPMIELGKSDAEAPVSAISVWVSLVYNPREVYIHIELRGIAQLAQKLLLTDINLQIRLIYFKANPNASFQFLCGYLIGLLQNEPQYEVRTDLCSRFLVFFPLHSSMVNDLSIILSPLMRSSKAETASLRNLLNR